MDQLGVNSYTCLPDKDSCNTSPLDNRCSNWVDRQISIFERYMRNNEDILNNLIRQIDLTGFPVFNAFWRDRPSPSAFDTASLLESIVNSVLGSIPQIGNYAKAIALVVENAQNLWPRHPPTQATIPNKADEWSNYVAQYASYVNDVTKGIEDSSRQALQDRSVLSDLLFKGPWFLTDPNNPDFNKGVLPSPNTVWNNLKPFYNVKIAMQSMQGQQIYFWTSRVPTCIQAVADSLASTIDNDGAYTNIAFCADGITVAVPVLGYEPRLYQKFTSVTSVLNLQPTDVWKSSRACIPDFGATYAIDPYYQPYQYPIVGCNTSTARFDITAPCTFSLPICEHNIWYPRMLSQNPNRDLDLNVNINNYAQRNMLKWCAYQFGFKSSVYYCVWVSTSRFGAERCKDWYAPKMIAVTKMNHPWVLAQQERIAMEQEGGGQQANKSFETADVQDGQTVLKEDL